MIVLQFSHGQQDSNKGSCGGVWIFWVGTCVFCVTHYDYHDFLSMEFFKVAEKKMVIYIDDETVELCKFEQSCDLVLCKKPAIIKHFMSK